MRDVVIFVAWACDLVRFGMRAGEEPGVERRVDRKAVRAGFEIQVLVG